MGGFVLRPKYLENQSPLNSGDFDKEHDHDYDHDYDHEYV